MVNSSCCPGDTVTTIASLELVKLVINSVLSHRGAKFAWFDAANFYMGNPLDHLEYVKIKIANISQEFINEYKLTQYDHNEFIHFDISKGVYSLPQSGRLSNDHLCTCLEKEGYYETTITPGLWRQKCHPILFSLIVDYFGVEHVIKCHSNHLALVIQQYHTIKIDWEGKKYAGIDLAWNYTNPNFCLTM